MKLSRGLYPLGIALVCTTCAKADGTSFNDAFTATPPTGVVYNDIKSFSPTIPGAFTGCPTGTEAISEAHVRAYVAVAETLKKLAGDLDGDPGNKLDEGNDYYDLWVRICENEDSWKTTVAFMKSVQDSINQLTKTGTIDSKASRATAYDKVDGATFEKFFKMVRDSNAGAGNLAPENAYALCTKNTAIDTKEIDAEDKVNGLISDLKRVKGIEVDFSSIAKDWEAELGLDQTELGWSFNGKLNFSGLNTADRVKELVADPTYANKTKAALALSTARKGSKNKNTFDSISKGSKQRALLESNIKAGKFEIVEAICQSIEATIQDNRAGISHKRFAEVHGVLTLKTETEQENYYKNFKKDTFVVNAATTAPALLPRVLDAAVASSSPAIADVVNLYHIVRPNGGGGSGAAPGAGINAIIPSDWVPNKTITSLSKYGIVYLEKGHSYADAAPRSGDIGSATNPYSMGALAAASLTSGKYYFLTGDTSGSGTSRKTKVGYVQVP